MLEANLTTNSRTRNIETATRAMLQRWRSEKEEQVQVIDMINLLAELLNYLKGRKSVDQTYIGAYKWLLDQFKQTSYGRSFFEQYPEALQVVDDISKKYKHTSGNNGFTPETNGKQQLERVVEWLTNGRNGDGQANGEILAWLRER